MAEHVQLGDLGSALRAENPGAAIDCPVAPSKGRYRGIVPGEALLRCRVAQLQAREAEFPNGPGRPPH